MSVEAESEMLKVTSDRDPVDQLSAAFLSCRNKEQMTSFLQDLCTPQELNSLCERWQIAQLLKQGMAYRKISTCLGVSTATVTRVARALAQGSGYKQVMDHVPVANSCLESTFDASKTINH